LKAIGTADVTDEYYPANIRCQYSSADPASRAGADATNVMVDALVSL
jgi:hypothetical protein